ncbi:MAG: DUF1837 domain-containing protein [Neisseriaceae bacterium]|nr:DUF1837 domain-containing protein [Neisseriaceae bacterium]
MSNTNFEFEVLIDDLFDNLKPDDFTLFPTDNKKVLSLVNGFQCGDWWYLKFRNFIFSYLPETALTKRERDSLLNESETRTYRAIENLRLTDKNDCGQASELAEILLYGIMKKYYGTKEHYRVLPVVPKIFYKQNTNANALGADSVHIVIKNEQDFSLWLGESKFYTNIQRSMVDAINSIENLLQLQQLRKENSIIMNLQELDEYLQDNPNLLKEIKDLLDENTSIDNIMPKLHIPILLLHECDITKEATEMTDKYKDDIIEYHKKQAEKYFKRQIRKLSTTVHRYNSIKFHLILFPVPEKKRIVESFIERIKISRSA